MTFPTTLNPSDIKLRSIQEAVTDSEATVILQEIARADDDQHYFAAIDALRNLRRHQEKKRKESYGLLDSAKIGNTGSTVNSVGVIGGIAHKSDCVPMANCDCV